jgi:predicted methyltransferase
MRLSPIAIAALLALTACSQSPEPQPTVAPKTEAVAEPAPVTEPMDATIAGSWRSPENVARDIYRHPKETLGFFGVKPEQVVVEITPGGGWYSEILAPLVKGKGRYIAAVIDPAKTTNARAAEYYGGALKELQDKFTGSPEQYGEAQIVQFDPAAPVVAEPASADVVLTFRNVHNWLGQDKAPLYFKSFFDALKPGGTLGVVEHSAAAGVTPKADSGYMTEQQIIDLATGAGFVLAERSDINANPKDTTDYANGVWSLPPTLRGGDQDRQKFIDIGESNRMTLRFTKPAASTDAPAGETAVESVPAPQQ